MIGRAGIGVDNVDIPAATAKGVIVMNTPFGNSITTAEHAITLMLALARQIPQADASTQAGKWEKNRFMGVEITSKTLGVIGCGNIGSIVADRAIGLRMRVIAYDPFLSPERAMDLGVEKVELDELFRRADFITLHTPLTEKTKNIIDAEAIAAMKKGVRIVNCARGGLVDEAALRAALDSGQVAGAAFDVFAEEPANENPLFGHPNVVCTPHLGAATTEAQENVALQVAEQMSDYLLRGAISNAVNFPSITAEEAPRLKPFVALAEKLGSFAGQLTETGITKVQISYEGVVAGMNTKALTSAAIAGLLRPMLQDINVVSAPIIAKERGIVIEETTRESRRRLREPDHRHGDDRAAVAPRLRHGVRRRPPAHRQHQGHPHGRGVRPVDDLHHQSRQAGLHRPLLLDAGRGRHQHRDLPCRPRGAGRQRHRADRDRRRTAARRAGEGARAAAGAGGAAAAVLTGAGCHFDEGREVISMEMQFWTDQRATLRELLAGDRERFLHWPLIIGTMFYLPPPDELQYLQSLPNWPFIRELIKDPGVGGAELDPVLQTNGNIIHHAYSIFRFESATGHELTGGGTILEIGGGYGNFCRLLVKRGFTGSYVIYDLPEFLQLQEWYLGRTLAAGERKQVTFTDVAAGTRRN